MTPLRVIKTLSYVNTGKLFIIAYLDLFPAHMQYYFSSFGSNVMKGFRDLRIRRPLFCIIPNSSIFNYHFLIKEVWQYGERDR